MIFRKNHEDKTAETFSTFTGKYVPLIDECIRQHFDLKLENSEYRFILKYYILLKEYCLRKGKRIRPLLLLLSYLGYSKHQNNLGEITKIASTLELLHAFFLIQDDIIDKSATRRGKKALHIVCDEHFSELSHNKNIGSDIAIILADVLMANVLEIIGAAKIKQSIKDNCVRLFSQTLEMTAWGQILDIKNSLSCDLDLDENTVTMISTLKTAYYTICNPMLIGLALSGSYNDEETQRIRQFAIPAGLAFQLRDDILGVFGESKVTGKSSESDIAEGKLTTLIQNTMSSIKPSERRRFESTFTKVKKSRSDIIYIRKKIEKSGALEQTTQRLHKLLDDARGNLEALTIHPEYRNILSELLDKMSNF